MPNTYHQVGQGPNPVIVLHGWFGDRHSFAAIEDMLDPQAFSYLFMDYRGYGGMQESAGLYTMAEIAQDVLALADHLGLDRFNLVGHSMGGMAIERVAGMAPQRIVKMIGIAPVPSDGVQLDQAATDRLYQASNSLEQRYDIIDRSTGGRLPRRWLNWKAAYSWQHSTRQAFAAYLTAWHQGCGSTASTIPFKLITGEHDPVFNAELMQATTLRRYPNALHEVLPNAGHYPMNETPLALIASMESFLRQT